MTAIRGGLTVNKLIKILSKEHINSKVSLLCTNSDDMYEPKNVKLKDYKTIVITLSHSPSSLTVKILLDILNNFKESVPVEIELENKLCAITGYSHLDTKFLLEFKK